METEEAKPKKRSRGIYLLPNLFTTAALFAGFYAILAAVNGKFEVASVAIFVAMLMDGLDGRVARLTKTQSAFGAEYDSLSDMVSFGLAPALVIYIWALSDLGKLGWLAAFIYTASSALRLARFNTQIGIADKKYFQGLPSPSAAAIVAGGVWLGVDYEISGQSLDWVAAVLTTLVGLLMVSNFRYHSFKEIDFSGKVPFIVLVVVMVVLAIIQTHPPTVLFALFLVYAISGPVLTLTQLRKHREDRVATDQDSGAGQNGE
ncbi:MAG: CDP-diacylglycerol--serine O-phosphatidyltransferase [Candidatus Thiodiazotropha lotti]|uniref:CDP-diacylglycerol--serine O-phosphatidyltransferase n=1 Tax=Candidatus Thiodiazotropha endoloripes TaxID=1818881 RepID=A0A1E2UQ13_9GAMM|nr:CDP-diacylglycerol--serine O-phosphatidyltransferase [Candidatus Thiodiazotropha endoloripes]MCG7897954.1 CDP-diacylglycerol--serine O-phosphatidyltransferase [Candidatus Thiodiazotropha weberae]MCG7992392.1 CDP-diacylglycerol--serine O-phosphatidyltransferase [Candidatus Thiodiazotropha lotti]MCG7903790.1 CDP-diacylglycerol--serine O-phosphatidyltransferase [Candidatus Thiodiazotropha weberae]MCG7912772.1 CDP-diacylglycerol--serine O-phosphatidyltransferase [Candidatus Thiodiazotropha weber